MFAIIVFVAAILILSRIYKKRQPKSIYRVAGIRAPFDGQHCNICGELYQGLAMDCKCTNYGR